MLRDAISAFVQTRWVSRRRSRAAFERWQARAASRWVRRDLPKVKFYAQAADFASLPMIDKATVMANFAGFNIARLDASQGWEIVKGAAPPQGLIVGASTGTSGNRGLFVISKAESFRWLGTMLAKAMPDMVWRRQRVAIILPQTTALYDSARRSGRIDLRFFPLVDGPETWRTEIEGFAPSVIVAPPKILRHCAEAGFALAPRRIFSAAETLDPPDRPVIEAAFGPLRQIYMATEGLLGVSCAHGTLHLAEDSTKFEFEPVGDGLVSPVITAFRRRTQIMARYRINDLLRLSDTPCPCGSPLQGVAEIVGRMDDVFRFDGGVIVTPDVLRNAVLDADRRIDDFRLVQRGRQVILTLHHDLDDGAAAAALMAVTDLLHVRRAEAQVSLKRGALRLDPSHKLRRVTRCKGAL
ncbi:CoF synthetase [Octadecabacter sp. SW4]|uniref:CoF synthetase n=1 Tax=Octadecabacter sp. SW4 TaxID=2602067 RepID=UPI0011C1D649|nr:CoF synthetase [Octadecabacter sp. SW4]QEE36051.1 CoF synthetase [Octadecabacter sp. SW4]